MIGVAPNMNTDNFFLVEEGEGGERSLFYKKTCELI